MSSKKRYNKHLSTMNRTLKIIAAAFLLVTMCISCAKQEPVTTTQLFVLSDSTNQSWNMEIVVKWGEYAYNATTRDPIIHVYQCDSTIINLGKLQTDSVDLFFVLNNQTAIGPFWMPVDYVDNYYINHSNKCWIISKLTNRETQKTYTWEQFLTPKTNEVFIPGGRDSTNSIPCPWRWTFRKSDERLDRFQCTIDTTIFKLD